MENKYNKLQESLQQSQQKNSSPWGQGGASNKKKSSPSTARKAQPQRGRSTLKHRPKQQGSRQPQHQKEKPTIPPTSSQTNTEEAPCGAGAHDHN